jgi:hypothetical protein
VESKNIESKNIKLPASTGFFLERMLAVRAQVLQVVGDGRRLGVVVQVLHSRAVLKCNVAAGFRKVAEALRHKHDQIVLLRVVSYKPPEITVELEADTAADTAATGVGVAEAAGCAEACCGSLARVAVEPGEWRRVFLAPLGAATC